MPTKVIKLAGRDGYEREIAAARMALAAGELVVFPTETVYGVGVNAALPEAVSRLRELKDRRDEQPFTVHIGRPAAARRFLTQPSRLFRRLARKLWPGPVTLIAAEADPTATETGRSLSGDALKGIYFRGTVGLRCPDHPVAAALLSAEDIPVIASSANLRNEPPPTDAEEALKALAGRIDLLLDAGRTRLGAASTVIELRGDGWQVHRGGALDERMIERAASCEIVFVCTGNSCRSPLAEHLFRQTLAARLGISMEALEREGFRVFSVGVHCNPGAPASPGTLAELARRGLDASGHRTQPVTVERLHRAEYIYTMSPEHRDAVLGLAPSAADRVRMLDPAGAVVDPIGGTAEDYRRCADQIAAAVERLAQEILDEDRDW